ncbi:MAG: trxA 2 [Verrucomicrobiales bacterium]|nr:trxA 2 [Verrucomicrobiales bacterium]
MNAMVMDEKGVVMDCPNCRQKNRITFGRLERATQCGKCKTELPAVDKPVEVPHEKTFQSMVGSSSVPVLVDFWASWCGPCRMAMPELEKLAKSNSGALLVAKVNTEEQGWLAQRFSIQSIPTMILFAHGSEVARISGARSVADLERFVSQATQAHTSAH